MTTHTVITDYYAGATLDAGSLLCHRTTDATVYTASATGEINTGGAKYSAVFTGVAAGYYTLKLKSGGEVVATRDVYFPGVDGETVQTGVRAELDSATQTQVTNIENASGYLLAVLAGACADPQTVSETYAITVFGSTFTVDMAGQTSTGTRTAPTLTKS
jgi:hypothetical protein